MSSSVVHDCDALHACVLRCTESHCPEPFFCQKKPTVLASLLSTQEANPHRCGCSPRLCAHAPMHGFTVACALVLVSHDPKLAHIRAGYFDCLGRGSEGWYTLKLCSLSSEHVQVHLETYRPGKGVKICRSASAQTASKSRSYVLRNLPYFSDCLKAACYQVIEVGPDCITQ